MNELTAIKRGRDGGIWKFYKIAVAPDSWRLPWRLCATFRLLCPAPEPCQCCMCPGVGVGGAPLQVGGGLGPPGDGSLALAPAGEAPPIPPSLLWP